VVLVVAVLAGTQAPELLELQTQAAVVVAAHGPGALGIWAATAAVAS
jgi:hypothetical protein